MELVEALAIVTTLADGLDPLTGRPLATDHVCQKPEVVRALYTMIQQLQRPQRGELENAGKPWSPVEEAELVRAFETGTKINALAKKHKRTQLAIRGRLYRLGRLPPWWPTRQRDAGA